MDIEKKVQILRACSSKKRNRCSSCPAFGKGDRNCLWNAMRDAATALSAQQAENEKLRSELEQKSKLIVQQAAELERRDTLLKEQEAELEQVKAERDAAVESIPHECKTCVYHTVFFNGCTLDHDCTNPDGGCSNNYDRWRWRGRKED